MKIFKRSTETQAFLSIERERSLNCSLGDLSLNLDNDEKPKKGNLSPLPDSDSSTSSTEDSGPDENIAQQQHPRLGLRQPSGRMILGGENDGSLFKKVEPSLSVLQKAANMGRQENDHASVKPSRSVSPSKSAWAKRTSAVKEAAASIAFHSPLKKRHSVDVDAKQAAPGSLSLLFSKRSSSRSRGEIETRSVCSSLSSPRRAGRLRSKQINSCASVDESDSISLLMGQESSSVEQQESPLASHLKRAVYRSRSNNTDDLTVRSSISYENSPRKTRSSRRQAVQRSKSADDSPALSLYGKPEREKNERRSISPTRSSRKEESRSMSPTRSSRKEESRSMSTTRSSRKEESRSMSPTRPSRKEESRSMSPTRPSRKEESRSMSPTRPSRKEESRSHSPSKKIRKEGRRSHSPSKQCRERPMDAVYEQKEVASEKIVQDCQDPQAPARKKIARSYSIDASYSPRKRIMEHDLNRRERRHSNLEDNLRLQSDASDDKLHPDVFSRALRKGKKKEKKSSSRRNSDSSEKTKDYKSRRNDHSSSLLASPSKAKRKELDQNEVPETPVSVRRERSISVDLDCSSNDFLQLDFSPRRSRKSSVALPVTPDLSRTDCV